MYMALNNPKIQYLKRSASSVGAECLFYLNLFHLTTQMIL
jgi:hypothetical protein